MSSKILIRDLDNKLHMLTQEEFEVQRNENPEGWSFPEEKGLTYKIMETGGDYKTMSVSPAKAQEMVKSGKYDIISSNIPKQSALKTLKESFVSNVTFGLDKTVKNLAGKKSERENQFAEGEFKEYQEKATEGKLNTLSKVAGFGGALATHTVGTGGTSLLAGGALKVGTKLGGKKVGQAVAKYVNKLNVGKYADKVGKLTEKGMSGLLKSQRAGKLSGKAAEMATFSVPAAVSVGIDNRDPLAAAKVIASGAVLGGVIPVAGAVAKGAGKVAKAPFKALKPFAEKSSGAVSSNFAKKFFNIKDPKNLREFTENIDRSANAIVKDLPDNVKNIWSKNLKTPLTPEKFKALDNETKLRIYGDWFKTKGFKDYANNKLKAYEHVVKEMDETGKKLSGLKDEINLSRGGEVFFKTESKHGTVNATRNLRELMSNQIKSISRSGKDLTPEGKAQLKALKSSFQALERFKSQTFKRSPKYLKAEKDYEIMLNKIKSDHDKNISRIQAFSERLKAHLKGNKRPVDASGLKKLQDMESKILNGIKDSERAMKIKLQKLNEARKNLYQTADVRISFKDMDMIENIYKKSVKDNLIKESSEVATFFKNQRNLKQGMVPKHLEDSFNSLNREYNHLKTLEKTFEKTGHAASALQGLGVFQSATQVGLAGAGALTGGMIGGPIGMVAGAMVGFLGYNVFPIMTQRGYGNLATAHFLTKMQSNLQKSSGFQKMTNNPRELSKWMSEGKDSVLGQGLDTSFKMISIKGIINMFEIDPAKETEKKTESDQVVSLFQSLKRGDFDKSFGSVDAAYSMYQQAGYEPNPALEVERFREKQKIKNAAMMFMPLEVKRAKTEEELKSVKLPKWKIDQFKDNFQTALSSEKILEKVRNSSLTEAQAQAFMRLNPNQYQETAYKLMQIKGSLSYTQKKTIDKLLGADKGGFYAYEDQGNVSKSNNTADKQVKRKVASNQGDFTGFQRGIQLG